MSAGNSNYETRDIYIQNYVSLKTRRIELTDEVTIIVIWQKKLTKFLVKRKTAKKIRPRKLMKS